MNNYVAIILAVIAVILVAEFVVEFADWNKEQACVSAGRRNCGGAGLLLNHLEQGAFAMAGGTAAPFEAVYAQAPGQPRVGETAGRDREGDRGVDFCVSRTL